MADRRTRFTRKLASCSPIFAATALAVVLTPAQAHANVWNLVSNMSDEFNYGLNTSKWNAQNVKSNVNAEIQYYTSNNAFTSNGVLELQTAYSGSCSGSGCNGYVYSGEVVSNSAISEGSSYAVEWRTMLPANGMGLWPADWLVTASCPMPLAQGNCNTWPPEVDVMEMTNGSDSNGFTDWWNTSPNQQDTHTSCQGVSGCGYGSALSSTFENGYHTYRVEVIAGGSIYYSVDGYEVSVHPNNEPTGATVRAVMNTAVGGNGAGNQNVSSNNGTQNQYVDYIRVYQLGPIQSGSIYVLRNKTSGMAFDSGNSPGNGSQMGQWPPADNGNQKWTLTATSNPGWYQVKNVGNSAVCLDNGGSDTNGAIMTTWACAGIGSNTNQNWYFYNDTRGDNQISNQTSNACLDDTNSSTTAGSKIQQWGVGGCPGGNNEQWDVSEACNGTSCGT